LPLSTPHPPQSHSPLLVDVDGDGHVEVNITDADLELKNIVSRSREWTNWDTYTVVVVAADDGLLAGGRVGADVS
jgi:biopolymer transport protein ExbD